MRASRGQSVKRTEGSGSKSEVRWQQWWWRSRRRSTPAESQMRGTRVTRTQPDHLTRVRRPCSRRLRPRSCAGACAIDHHSPLPLRACAAAGSSLADAAGIFAAQGRHHERASDDHCGPCTLPCVSSEEWALTVLGARPSECERCADGGAACHTLPPTLWHGKATNV